MNWRAWRGAQIEDTVLRTISVDIAFDVQLFEDKELEVFFLLTPLVNLLLSTAPEMELFGLLETTRKPITKGKNTSPRKDLVFMREIRASIQIFGECTRGSIFLVNFLSSNQAYNAEGGGRAIHDPRL